MNWSGRVPAEPDSGVGSGIRLFSLDFEQLPGEQGSEEYNGAIREYVDRLTQQCLDLTAPTDELSWTDVSEKDNISCQHLQVAGTPLQLFRHVAHFAAPAHVVFGLYSALNYTCVIDPYAWLVETEEGCEGAVGSDYEWCHVAWTVDSFGSLFAVRDFVSLDYANANKFLIVSRSVKHGSTPETPPPTQTSFMFKNLKSRTYRVPLLYVLHVVPIDADNCTVTQLQWSDVGGVLSDKIIEESVEKFGYDNLVKMRKIAQRAVERKVSVPIENPILPKWVSDPYVKIPELKP